jgi:hypothetical protein
MQLQVKTLSRSQFNVDIEPSAQVSDLKKTIEAKEGPGSAADCQKLIFQGARAWHKWNEDESLICSLALGKILENEKTVEFYGMKENDSLVMMIVKVPTLAGSCFC